MIFQASDQNFIPINLLIKSSLNPMLHQITQQKITPPLRLQSYTMNHQVFKIVILGQGRVGKSSIALQFVQNKFSDSQQSTINACCLQKPFVLPTGKHVTLSLWDTAGQEKYSSLAPMYYRDALAAIIVYDITFLESFDKVKKWTNQLREHANHNILIYIVGNKCDLEPMRKITKSNVVSYCKGNDLKHFDVSAKTGEGLENMFAVICEEIIQENAKSEEKLVIGGKGKNGRNGKGGKSGNSSFDHAADNRVSLTKEPERKKEAAEKTKCC